MNPKKNLQTRKFKKNAPKMHLCGRPTDLFSIFELHYPMREIYYISIALDAVRFIQVICVRTIFKL